MKETGIIMSGNHPKLIIEGKKTMTRRVIKHPEQYEHIRECDFCCPYGEVSDRLWVKERHYLYSTEQTPKGVIYYADAGKSERDNAVWRPSIFLPRWASRILLEITGIKVERLQEITAEDCKAEGVSSEPYEHYQVERVPAFWIHRFEELWDSLNAKRGYSFESNPWVFVISFKVIKE